jgi:hypothetical protein
MVSPNAISVKVASSLLSSPNIIDYYNTKNFQANTNHAKMSNMIKGKKIIPSGVIPEKHELKTADFFTDRGVDVEFIKSS